MTPAHVVRLPAQPGTGHARPNVILWVPFTRQERHALARALIRQLHRRAHPPLRTP